MAIIKCSNCGKNISSGAPVCPFCSRSPVKSSLSLLATSGGKESAPGAKRYVPSEKVLFRTAFAMRLSIAGIITAAMYLLVVCVYASGSARYHPFVTILYWSLLLSPLAFLMSISGTLASFMIPSVGVRKMPYIIANACGLLFTGFVLLARLAALVM